MIDGGEHISISAASADYTCVLVAAAAVFHDELLELIKFRQVATGIFDGISNYNLMLMLLLLCVRFPAVGAISFCINRCAGIYMHKWEVRRAWEII